MTTETKKSSVFSALLWPVKLIGGSAFGRYIVKRVLWMVPTLFIILTISFAIIQFAPGGPVETMINTLQGGTGVTERFTGGGSELMSAGGGGGGSSPSKYRGAQGIDPEIIKRIERDFGMDKPMLERYVMMLKNYITFDLGNSYFKDRPVVDLVVEKIPVSLLLGAGSFLLGYLISIPLGIYMAVREGGALDRWATLVLVALYAIPGFLFAVMLMVVFAGGQFLDWFPIRGYESDVWTGVTWGAKMMTWQWWQDMMWHMVLPTIAMSIGGFTATTMLTRNSFLDEIRKQYVVTARAKGLNEQRVMYGHVFRNAMILIIAGLPSALVSLFFTGSLLIETIFSIDGLGLLGYESTLNRDYPVMFGTLYVFTLVGLIMHLIGDVMYRIVDPNIDFEAH